MIIINKTYRNKNARLLVFLTQRGRNFLHFVRFFDLQDFIHKYIAGKLNICRISYTVVWKHGHDDQSDIILSEETL